MDKQNVVNPKQWNIIQQRKAMKTDNMLHENVMLNESQTQNAIYCMSII